MSEKMKITVIDLNGGREVKVGVPLEWTIDKFVTQFVQNLKLPFVDKNKNPVIYEAVLDRTSIMLTSNQTIQELGIQENNIIRPCSPQRGGG